jgi:hypothetical protein
VTTVLGPTTGPLFVSRVRGSKADESLPSQKRLSGVCVNRLVKKYLGDEYSAHSPRASFITTAKLNSQNQTEQKTCGW